MARVYEMIEAATLTGADRLYVVLDPTGTPLNRYVDISTLDARWAPLSGEFDVNIVAVSGATETLTLAPAHDVTMSENCALTFPTPTGNGHAFLLLLQGAFTPTFPAAVVTAPTYTTASLYAVHTVDGGTNWFMNSVEEGVTLA